MRKLAQSISYDARAILLDGERSLIFGGAIHYPRSTPEMWPELFRRSREAGLTAIETYVFWHLHEPERGVYDFSGRLDLQRFCREAQEQGLHVILRIGPYICAEINYGGLPAWLRELPGIQMRTENEPFQREMERWVRHLCAYLKPYFAPEGGPIMMVQMENEYNLVAANYGEAGKRYLQWSADLGISLDLGVPLIMCYGAAEGPIETINSFEGHTLLDDHKKRHPDQPALWTECWTGWYDTWGNEHRTRSAQNLTYAIARFIAAGGSGVNYYMWHGGTNFAREAMFLQTTSYDYNAPLDEYGLPTPKYAHMAALQQKFHQYEQLLLGQEAPQVTPVDEKYLAFTYTNGETELTFLCNDLPDAATLTWRDKSYTLAGQSVQLLQGETLLFDTSVLTSEQAGAREITPLAPFPHLESWKEPVGERAGEAQQIRQERPVEQLQFTKDTTDYCWYVTEIEVDEDGNGELTLDGFADIAYVFVDGERVGISTLYLHERRGRFDGSGFVQSFPLTLTTGKHRLAILCCALGLIKGDWMIGEENMVQERKGIWGPVTWQGAELSGEWTLLPGLQGEQEQRFVAETNAWNHLAGSTNEATDTHEGLIWYKTSFARPTLRDAHALVLDMEGMHKGLLWLNGHCLGRYWLLAVHDRDEEGQPTGKTYPPDERTQRYYHVPLEWLQDENTLVVFEELGGEPTKIQLCEVR